MDWVEIMPRYASLFRQRRWDSASSFLSWTGILVNRHRRREVEQVTFPPACGVATARLPASAKPQAEVAFFIKKEYAVSWRDRVHNAWHGFGWCATAVREAAMLQALREAGISCPEVVALGEVGRQAFVMTLAESSMRELREILPTLNDDERNCLADALGRELARMHAAGFDHPDLYAKHILVAKEGATFRFCILDWQRGRRRRSVAWRLRVRDLAVLDATLHESLASDRLRLRCLRSYARERPDVPFGRLARSVRRAAVLLREKRNLREVGQRPVPAHDQQFVRVGSLLVVRSYHDKLGGRLPDWLLKSAAPAEWRQDELPGETPPLAHTLFRLQRFGVRAPRLLAIDFGNGPGVAYFEPIAAAPLAEAVAKARPAMRAHMLQQAGLLVRQVHDAGYRLCAGESWEHCLGVMPETGEVVLVRVESLERGKTSWQELVPLELGRSTLMLSRTEQLRFLRGYLRESTRRATRAFIRSESPRREREAVS